MSLIKKYHKFLTDNNIYTFEILKYFLKDFDIKEESNYMIINIKETTNLDKDIYYIFNGLIISKLNIFEILCYTGDYQKIIKTKDIKKIFNFNLRNIKFYQVYNGTFIRLYFFLDKWIITTNDQLNLYNTNIISNLFIEICTKMNFDHTLLNKNYIYTFSLNNENKSLVHINTYKTLTFEEVNININMNKNIEVKIKNITNLLEICKYTKINQNIIGFMIKDTINNKEYIIYTENFLYLSYLYCDEPDIIKRYIKLKRRNLIDEYIRYYQEYSTLFGLLDIIFETLVEYYYKAYVDTRILKKDKLPQDMELYEEDIMYKIHGVYLALRVNTSKITVNQVLLNYNIDRLVYLLMKD